MLASGDAMEQSDKGTVIIVEDDGDATTLYERWLEKEGYCAHSYGDAESFLAALDTILPDAVILDIGLPGINGLEALSVVRRRHSTVPVVIITADSSASTAVEAMRSGAYDYITKPVDRARLATVARNAVEKSQLSHAAAAAAHESATEGYFGIIGNSGAMKSLF
ncbi:MAG: response regulator, partial [Myxococcota bacterium]